MNSGLRQYELCGMVSGLHIYFMLNFTTFVICVALTPYARNIIIKHTAKYYLIYVYNLLYIFAQLKWSEHIFPQIGTRFAELLE